MVPVWIIIGGLVLENLVDCRSASNNHCSGIYLFSITHIISFDICKRSWLGFRMHRFNC